MPNPTRRALIALLVLAGLSLAVAAPAAPLPERTPPTGFSSVNGAGGGRTLAGTFSGNARSAAAVLGGVLGGPARLLRRGTGRLERGRRPARPRHHGLLRRPPPGHAGARRRHGPAQRRRGKGFDYYLRGVEVLEHAPSGARGNFDRDFADAVVKADPTKFRLVLPSQYRATD